MNELTFYFLASAAYVNGAQILLNNNKLTGVDQSAFQAILEYFKKNGINATIAIGNSRRFDSFYNYQFQRLIAIV